jgi:translation initiation factor IF-1
MRENAQELAAGKGEAAGERAIVIELLPNAAYRLELENRSQVVAHAAGAGERNFVRLRPKDRVLVRLSPHDASRGRIVKLLKKG